jgi:hypothetical protein
VRVLESFISYLVACHTSHITGQTSHITRHLPHAVAISHVTAATKSHHRAADHDFAAGAAAAGHSNSSLPVIMPTSNTASIMHNNTTQIIQLLLLLLLLLLLSPVLHKRPQIQRLTKLYVLLQLAGLHVPCIHGITTGYVFCFFEMTYPFQTS